jgi:hypothetical protein
MMRQAWAAHGGAGANMREDAGWGSREGLAQIMAMRQEVRPQQGDANRVRAALLGRDRNVRNILPRQSGRWAFLRHEGAERIGRHGDGRIVAEGLQGEPFRALLR